MKTELTAAVRLKKVRRAFGRRAVLKGVTAAAETGKVIGLLGRNGEGKTTLFRIMLDMLAADSGSLEVLGRRPDGSGDIRQSVGYVPERPSFHNFMTVEGVLELRARFFNRWDKGKAAKLCRQLELDPKENISGASKGTLGKIAWVCAAAHDPALLLLDEPTSGLDALVREDVLRNLIGELHGSGKTILVANHHMEELAGVLDEVWVLAGGVISGVHQMDSLRAESCRIIGRLKSRAEIPVGLAAVELPADGPLMGWAAFDRETAERLYSGGFLENAERRPLAIEETLRLILRERAGGRHD